MRLSRKIFTHAREMGVRVSSHDTKAGEKSKMEKTKEEKYVKNNDDHGKKTAQLRHNKQKGRRSASFCCALPRG